MCFRQSREEPGLGAICTTGLRRRAFFIVRGAGHQPTRIYNAQSLGRKEPSLPTSAASLVGRRFYARAFIRDKTSRRKLLRRALCSADCKSSFTTIRPFSFFLFFFFYPYVLLYLYTSVISGSFSFRLRRLRDTRGIPQHRRRTIRPFLSPLYDWFPPRRTRVLAKRLSSGLLLLLLVLQWLLTMCTINVKIITNAKKERRG